MTTPLTRRVAAAACIGTLALAVLAGCERRQPEVPTPKPSFPVPQTQSQTPQRATAPASFTAAAAAPMPRVS